MLCPTELQAHHGGNRTWSFSRMGCPNVKLFPIPRIGRTRTDEQGGSRKGCLFPEAFSLGAALVWLMNALPARRSPGRTYFEGKGVIRLEIEGSLKAPLLAGRLIRAAFCSR